MERCREVVLDSSIVVKWFSNEIKTDKALRLRDSYIQGSLNLTVSETLIAEVANALRYKPDYDVEKWRTALTQLFNLRMKVAQLTQDLAARAGEISYDGKVTFYDALPVAIAEHKKTVCVTADEETQYKKLQIKGYPIELL
jgi:predicted nucleic acid-binding protein